MHTMFRIPSSPFDRARATQWKALLAIILVGLRLISNIRHAAGIFPRQPGLAFLDRMHKTDKTDKTDKPDEDTCNWW